MYIYYWSLVVVKCDNNREFLWIDLRIFMNELVYLGEIFRYRFYKYEFEILERNIIVYFRRWW